MAKACSSGGFNRRSRFRSDHNYKKFLPESKKERSFGGSWGRPSRQPSSSRQKWRQENGLLRLPARAAAAEIRVQLGRPPASRHRRRRERVVGVWVRGLCSAAPVWPENGGGDKLGGVSRVAGIYAENPVPARFRELEENKECSVNG